MSENNETKQKIIQATLDVIEEKSISGVRMRNIAEKAGLFQSNLHYYYKSKDDLLLDAQKEVANRCVEIRKDVKSTTENTLESQLDVFIKQKLIFIKNETKFDYAEINFWIESRFNGSFRDEFKRSFYGWRNELQELIENYAPDYKEENKVLLASVIISLLEGATIQYLVDTEAFSVEDYFDYCKRLIIKEIQN